MSKINQLAEGLYEARETQTELAIKKLRLEAELAEAAPVLWHQLEQIKEEITAANKAEASAKALFVEEADRLQKEMTLGKGRHNLIPGTLFKEFKEAKMELSLPNVISLYELCVTLNCTREVFKLDLSPFREGITPPFVEIVSTLKPFVDGHDKWPSLL